MDENNSCQVSAYFWHSVILLNHLEINYVDDFINTSIPLWHRNMTYTESVPSWFLLKLKVIELM